MEEVYRENLDDPEAAVFFALSLLATASPKDKSHAKQFEAAGLLNWVRNEQPHHPGVLHYLIHSRDEQARNSRSHSVAVRPKLTVSTAEAAVDAASAGLGIARVYSYQAAAAISEGRLVRVLEHFEPAVVPVHVIHGEGRSPRPKVRAFVQLAVSRLRDSLETSA